MQELVGLSMAVEAYKITETDSAKIINYRSMNARAGSLESTGETHEFLEARLSISN